MTCRAMIGRPYRGDLTINSLFYNINLRCVEDFTGMGLADLQEGVVRTPLAPRTTFLDDPLRILVRRCRLNP
jgi:tRNA nucleotidyltransferase (CCA-adding enzyme)